LFVYLFDGVGGGGDKNQIKTQTRIASSQFKHPAVRAAEVPVPVPFPSRDVVDEAALA